MPTTLPSSFASAAAGNSADNSTRGSTRGDGGNYADWSRRPNGATQTFRRSSTTPIHSSSSSTYQRDSTTSSSTTQPQSGNVYVPPHLSASRNGAAIDTRYAKSDLLDLFKLQKEVGDLDNFPKDLYVGDVDLSLSNGTASHKWLRRDESSADPPGAEVCWDREGSVEPLGLFEMTDEERELFTTSVNSPLKGPNQPGSREGTTKDGLPARKVSISQSTSNTFGSTTPTASKPVGRRREPSESFSVNRDSPGPSTGKSDSPATSSLFRRRTEVKESGSSIEERDKETFSLGSNPPFGSIKRTTTGPLSAGLNAPSSPWSNNAQAEAMSPMGTFGSFALGGGRSGSISAEKRPGLGASRGESRFRGLMNKPSTDEEMGLVRERGSMSSLNKVEESDSRTGSRGFDSALDQEIPEIAGRESLGEHSIQQHTSTEYGLQPTERFGLGRGSFAERQSQSQAYQSYGVFGSEQEEPMSPTFTNPYRSPEQTSSNLRELEGDEMDENAFHLPGLGGFQDDSNLEFSQTNFSAQQRGSRVPAQEIRQFDQPASTGAPRAFPSLSGLGALPGLGSPGPWSPNVGSGTPGRERGGFNDAFGDAVLRSPGALQSPGISGLGAAASGNLGRGSRLGSLFPGAMQEQMRSTESSRSLKNDEVLLSSSEDASAHFGTPPSQGTLQASSSFRREGESPFNSGRGKFDDFFGSAEKQQKGEPPMPTSSQPYSPSQVPSSVQASSHQGLYGSQPQAQPASQQSSQRVSSFGASSSGQPPAAQQKTMVMPDRIRWIYRDPQGNTQGPWSGLEMHDWYRAGFFSPELLVKKLEDPDYEPLAQLIRRIGNSREPFLVPQIGIPGPPSTQSGAAWPGQATPTAPSAAPGQQSAQPPFAGSFPSFGTTLTAEQQNALERRKQEEQYLMARQKEHLAQQQMMMKQLQMQGQSTMHSQLQHHSSAQSLHSQPSFGSVTSPNGFQQQTPQMQTPISQNMPGNFERGNYRSGAPGSMGQMDPLNLGRDGQGQFAGVQGITTGRSQFQEFSSPEQRTAAMLNDRQRLQQEQAKAEYLQRGTEDVEASMDRFKEFQDLRKDIEIENYGESEEMRWKRFHSSEEFDQSIGIQSERSLATEDLGEPQSLFKDTYETDIGELDGAIPVQNLSLTEQVQKAASAKRPPIDAAQSPWAKIESTSVEQAPPLSTSPLPAPAARRSRQNVADALAVESGSQSASPSVEATTSSVAPWAKDPVESQKQPSLKEIQEAEARRAAKQEEIAAAARRAALEKDLASQAAPPQPGLPSTSTWGSSESPINSAGGTGSVWTKPVTGKTTAATSAGGKKTLQQIQKEQEALARKQKAAVAPAATTTNNGAVSTTQATASGKRYADLASKAASPGTVSPSAAGGAWTTVGAGGKPKVPTIATGPPAATRTVSTGTVPSAPAPAPRPKPTTSASSTSLANAQVAAHEEFKKWALGELRPDLNKGVHAEEFVAGLLSLPPETEMITEAVHQVSQTLDSRHFAEEFVRRRALADKGKSEPSPTTSSGAVSATVQGTESKSAGGWNEVARKGPSTSAQKDESSAFKIVAKKKGGKR